MTNTHTHNHTKTNTNTIFPFLGEDALFNIFMRCDPMTVGRVRCTSNTWRWQLRGPEFARVNWIANDHRSVTDLFGHGYSSYGEKSNWATHVNAGDNSVNIVRLPFEIKEAGYFTIVGSDNGNLCVKYSHTGEDTEILVLNPLTKKVVHVDDQSYRHIFYKVSVYAFGYLKDSYKDFHVIYLCKNSFHDKNLRWMLWDSRLRYWRTRGVYLTEIEKVGPTSVAVAGVVFWIGWGGFFNLEPTHLLAFSLDKEVFFQEPIPKENTSTYNSITKINKELGFVSYKDIGFKRKLDVWNLYFTEQNNFLWQKLYHVEDFGIPYKPSFFNGNEIISLIESRTTLNGSNDDLRTEVVMSKMKKTGGNREVIYCQGWQLSVFVKSIICHRDGLFEFDD